MFVLFWVLWMFFVDSLTTWEMLSGIAAAAAGVAGAALFKAVGNLHFHCTLRDLAELGTIPLGVVTDTVTLLSAMFGQLFLGRPAGSHMQATPFNLLHDNPHGLAHRALAVTLPTITPNTIVLGLIESQNLLLFHQIKPEGVPQIVIHLEASPDTNLGAPR